MEEGYIMKTNDVEKILISESELKKRIKELGEQITKDYRNKEELVIIGILKGSVVFLSDLIRNISLPLKIDFMTVSSYGNSAVSTGNITIKKDLDCDIAGKHVVIAEDIIDSGITLSNLVKILEKRNPASLKICALLDKKERREAEIDVDYIGFEIPNEFIVGYGLDYAENYRNLPYVGILKREIYE